ncbi:primosomal protein N' [Candidatus Pseudomonas adelgestsugas]|uniref:Replication restart protein PriA n=1 Tax=Candidatus Pseudomonas adelgestsugas TaxID=1302376 RepID=A0ABX5R7Y2_9PSED|nr:primosomal protein N' [Candidatus Pseudomonas adelgestsugas]QAX81547.1 Primosomal protein N' [Candidatus Pseudomonas adelgestsugas]
MPDAILRLALLSPLRNLFDYRAPADVPLAQLQSGVRVRVPFGHRKTIGIVIEVTDHSTVPVEKLKSALAILDVTPLLPPSLLKLCLWAAQYYQHSIGDTLSLALPALLRQGELAEDRQERFWSMAPGVRLDDPRLTYAPRQRETLAIIAKHPHGIANQLLSKLLLSRASLNLLLAKGLVQVEIRKHNTSQRHSHWLAQPELPLNSEQSAAYKAIRASFDSFHAFLIAGVTGSGKTEVYLQLIHETLQSGKQALVLIPEINLGPQTIARFKQRFHAYIALMHSAVNNRERLKSWLAARDGRVDIIIGTRSALFTPMQNPGLIIIDEEHDSSYKQQEGVRYHARDLALVRARQEGIPIVLGSATPSLESLHNAYKGRYGLIHLNERAGNAKQPRFIRLDIKSYQLNSGISKPMQQAIGQTLAIGQQVLVFLNRRGFAPTLLCYNCGWMSECLRCDARMTVHQRYSELRCHHCGYAEQMPHHCKQCGIVDLHPVGAGTERAEEHLEILFPAYPVLRVDQDSTARKDAMNKLLATIQKNQACILLGTQMLSKGHHFPLVTLVSILDADSGLFSSDFRGSEHMAQLIMQVAGRAGRANEPSKVIIQTHFVNHPLLIQLTEKGYLAFAKQMLKERCSANLPPFTHLALLRAEAHKPGQAENFLDKAYSTAEYLLSKLNLTSIELLGPVPAPMERRAGRYRAQLLLQAMSRAPLHKLLNSWLITLEQIPGSRKVRWSLDVDPIDLY